MMPLAPAERLFIGNYPGGMVYADRSREKHGDYARVAFLPWNSLVLQVEPGADPSLVALAEQSAAAYQSRRGQLHALSATALRDADGNLIGCGQTVRLGYSGAAS